ncbi:MAG: C25 family cysteine peptidase [Kiritimatiellia bacterium]
MKQYIYTLLFAIYLSASGCLLFGWNNQEWLGNGDRVVAWDDDYPADYLRLGVLEEGIYCVSADDIASAFGIAYSEAAAALSAGEFFLSNSTNSVAWTTDGTNLFFFGQATDELYAPENVYFLRPQAGNVMESQLAPADPNVATNTWFMQKGLYRSDILDVTYYFDRRSSNASITNELIFGVYLGSSYGGREYCEFSPSLPGYTDEPYTNINFAVHAISYGDYNAPNDTHQFELLVEGSSCGVFSWSGEQKIVFESQISTTLVTNSDPVVKIASLDTDEDILLLDVEIEYPRRYELLDEPLLCTGGVSSNIAVSGTQSDASVMIWDISDPCNSVKLDVSVNSDSNGWSSVFRCGDAAKRYAVSDPENCYQPSVCGFMDVDWSASGAISSLVIVTPPRRWVSGFEDALQPLVRLRRAQGLGVRVVDAEEIYNAFSYGLANPHAFQDFADAGANSGSRKLRYLLFAGYASTDYKLEVFYPDTIFKNGHKGFPALFPLLQLSRIEAGKGDMLLLPNDMMLGDADGSGVPEVAVGRFLATDATELSNMVSKTVTHDLKHTWNQALIVSDWNNTGSMYFDFESVAAQLNSDFLQRGWDTDYFYCENDSGFSSIWDYDFNPSAKDMLCEGRDFFYYLGHSSDRLMGHSGDDAKYLLNPERLNSADWMYAPLAMCMGCRMGRFTALDVVNFTYCLMETAVKNPYSGFSATFSSAGYLTFGDAKNVTELISDEINLYGAERLGDAITASLDQMGAAGVADVRDLVLLGDPSMPLYKPGYPTVIKIR